MEKIKIGLTLGILFFVLLPFCVLAQFPKAQMSNCCKLKHTIDVSTITYTWNPVAGCTIIPIAGGYTISETCVVSEKAATPAPQSCSSKGQTLTINIGTADWGGICTMDTIYTVTDFLFWIFLGFSVIFGVYVGIMFMTAGGNPSQVEKARSMVIYLVIGIVIAIAVKLIPSLARAIIGV